MTPTTLQGKRDAAMVLLGFATAARVSELVAFDVADIVRTEHGLDTSIYRRKVKLFTENAILYGTDPATCPVRALTISKPWPPLGAPTVRCSSGSTGRAASPRR